jgi:hypothetical protein
MDIFLKTSYLHVQDKQVLLYKLLLNRTWSIILVDAQLNVDYIEKTMKEPINTNDDIEWITTKNNFKIEK